MAAATPLRWLVTHLLFSVTPIYWPVSPPMSAPTLTRLAMSCGLPVVLTPNTGASDFVRPGANGEVVPIRDPVAISEAIFKWADRILSGEIGKGIPFDASPFSFETFEKEFLGQLKAIGLV